MAGWRVWYGAFVVTLCVRIATCTRETKERAHKWDVGNISYPEALYQTDRSQAPLSLFVEQYPCMAMVDVTKFGAVGDGKTVNTEPIQAAINFTTARQGGCVYIPDGTFVTGSLLLLNNVYLMVQGRLLGSPQQSDYPKDWTNWVVIRSYKANNIAIFGSGVIDGGAIPNFVAGYNASVHKYEPVRWTSTGCSGECRPRLVQLVFSTNILLRDVTLTNSADWTTHILGCQHVLATNLTIHGDREWPNNDGFDIDSSINVTLSHSSISTGDDSICFKSTEGYGVVQDILVHDMLISSKSCGIKVGSTTQTNITNVHVENITITNSNRGLGVQARDAGHISDFVYKNISLETRFCDPTWWGRGEPIWITSVYRTSTDPLGTVSNLTFIDVRAKSENGVFVSGRGHTVTNILFQDVAVNVSHWTNFTRPGHSYVPSVPPQSVTCAVDVFYFEEVDNVVMKGCAATFVLPASPAPRPAYYGKCLNCTQEDHCSNVEHSDLACVNGFQ